MPGPSGVGFVGTIIPGCAFALRLLAMVGREGPGSWVQSSGSWLGSSASATCRSVPRKRHHVHEHAPIPAASSANVWPRALFAALHHVSEVGYVLSLRERRYQMLAKEFQGLLRIGLFPVLLQRGLILPALEHHELVLAAFHLEHLELVVARLHPCEADAWHHLSSTFSAELGLKWRLSITITSPKAVV